MKKFNFRYNKQKMIVGALVVLIISLISLTVVYASLSAMLTITGSTDVVASTWSVYLANGSFTTTIPSSGSGSSVGQGSVPMSYVPNDYKVVQLMTGVPGGQGGGACLSGTDCISSMSGTTGSFTTAPLSKPGDFKAIKFDVINDGGIAAKLDSFILNGISTAQDVYLDYYILYSDGTTPKSGDVLSGGSTKSMVLVIEFDKDTSNSQLPTTNQSLSLSFTLNYVQAD